MSSTSFASAPNVGCKSYSLGAAMLEEFHYGQMSDAEFADSVDWYYSACMEANGNISDPVFK